MTTLAEMIGLKALSKLDPESAHKATLLALKSGLAPVRTAKASKRLETKIGPLTFANPVGIAAGFDKNADVLNPVFRLGFGFAEIGSVTPKPQPGNPKPRAFRLPEHQAVINRYGFNSEGHKIVHQNVLDARATGIVGINVGANKDSPDRVADYVLGLGTFADCASYFTVNISSPNTPGLRDLQTRSNLEALVGAVSEESARLTEKLGRSIPIFVKIAPDLAEADLEDVCDVVSGSTLDGLIVSNTTLSRAGVESAKHAGEAGGLSGRPLFERSTIMLAKTRRLVGPDMPIIGVGGVTDADSAWQKIVAGANLVQVYTGLVYKGPALLREILGGLDTHLSRQGMKQIGDAVGTGTSDWAARDIPAIG